MLRKPPVVWVARGQVLVERVPVLALADFRLLEMH